MVKCPSCKKEVLSYAPSPAFMFKEEREQAKHGGTARTCRLDTGEAETGGYLGSVTGYLGLIEESRANEKLSQGMRGT